jgi:hypothetical protein
LKHHIVLLALLFQIFSPWQQLSPASNKSATDTLVDEIRQELQTATSELKAGERSCLAR